MAEPIGSVFIVVSPMKGLRWLELKKCPFKKLNFSKLTRKIDRKATVKS